MRQTLAEKLIGSHLVEGVMAAGEAIAITIDQTLTQDSTGTMAWLQFEALGVPRVRTELSVSYADHNLLQADFRNADDHRYLQTTAAKYGAFFSRPGNGICHQVHLERFGVPGKTLLGSDSHTPNAGALGMLAIGAGGLDVAVAMAGGPFHTMMPSIVGVRLMGELGPWVSAKDAILELLRQMSVKGGVGRIIEYYGPGVATLSVPQRATIGNMGAELGATTSVFPSDERTRIYLAAQGRGDAWRPLAADDGAAYAETIEISLGSLEPLVAQPSSPDRVVPVRELAGLPVAQVCIGSCVNSSYEDLTAAAGVLKDRSVDPGVSLAVTPGTRQVLAMIAQGGQLADLVLAGARVLECGCGPCIGMGQAPPTGVVSLRSFNRNFKGRSGTADDQVYLASAETCAATALSGRITDPRGLGEAAGIEHPAHYVLNDSLLVGPLPVEAAANVEVVRGPNIQPVPLAPSLPDTIRGRVLLKAGDNVTTDHIMPSGAHTLPLRSNVPALAEHVFARTDPDFVRRARGWDGGIIVGGTNYGQGSSREHAALVPMYLGLKAVLARSFARIHRANLINVGLVPLVLGEAADYDGLQLGDELAIEGVPKALRSGTSLRVRNVTQGRSFGVTHDLSEREVRIVQAGGMLNYIREGGE